MVANGSILGKEDTNNHTTIPNEAHEAQVHMEFKQVQYENRIKTV